MKKEDTLNGLSTVDNSKESNQSELTSIIDQLVNNSNGLASFSLTQKNLLFLNHIRKN